MITKSSAHFDYAIIGSGVAGFQLALAFAEDSFFKEKRIAIFEKSIKNKNDKSFSFWEKGNGKWDGIVCKKWNSTHFFNTDEKQLKIDLNPYTYKTINAIDFYNFSLEKLKLNPQFIFLTEEVNSVIENAETVTIKTEFNYYTCNHAFDSRISKQFIKEKNNYPYVDQSFYGWEIKTETPAFDPDVFTMMDYRFRWKNSTSFMYILPKNKTEALVEYTFFAPFTIYEEEFKRQLQNYILEFLPETKFSITRTETGVIPMSAYPFEKEHSNRITKIGTAGGWVKASTGYSFKRSEKFTKAVVEQLKNNQKPIGYQPKNRFRFYDKLLLKVLENQNKKVPNIFYKMYKNTEPDIFYRFLDEETSLFEEIRLISKLPYLPYLKELFGFNN